MQKYEYIIKDKAGNVIASLDSARSRSYESALNKTGSASFVVSPTDAKVTNDLLLLGNKELYIYRYGTLIWGGELVYKRTDLSDGQETITVNAKGFFDLLDKKVVGSAASPRLFSNDDLGDIAWTIIDESQTGTDASFGITRGAHPTTRNADRTYEYKNLKEAIEGLSNLNVKNGFDFALSANKQFDIWYPTRGRVRDDIVFEWGRNVLSFSEVQDATNMANQVIVLGEGQGSEMITATRNNTGVQPTYKIRQRVIQAKDVNQSATLNDHGDKELEEKSVQQQIIGLKYKGDVDPILGSYELGDSVRVIIKYGTVQIDSYFRVYGIKVRVSDEDDEEVELIFNAQ